MTDEDLLYFAKNKVRKILKENGFNYLSRDFSEVNCFNCKKTSIYIMKLYQMKNKILRFEVYFYDVNNNKRGELLKKNKDKFLNYYNAIVDYNKIIFNFTYKELEIEYIKFEDGSTKEIKNEQIMKKIEKLLALQQSPNEHEALSASLMVQKLLAKYNLSLDNIDKNDDDVIEEVNVWIDGGNKFKYLLADVIADNYRCKVYYKGTSYIVFRGYRTDIIVARRVYVYLFNICKKLGKKYENNYRQIYGTAVGIYNSYCAGFIGGIKSELEKQCTALQLFCPEKVDVDWQEYSKTMGEKNTSITALDGEAYSQGSYDGKNSLNAQFLDDSERYIKE